ncbi:MAG TPA: hypothetical protein PKA13_00880 [Geminicoccaceae bacterium]|nr:hypothetical protein [Geminicoccus sp.]HMU48293.1 hypothetical protein [Geminicoccaceae bacterium]
MTSRLAASPLERGMGERGMRQAAGIALLFALFGLLSLKAMF